jgi:hypothetical protein
MESVEAMFIAYLLAVLLKKYPVSLEFILRPTYKDLDLTKVAERYVPRYVNYMGLRTKFENMKKCYFVGDIYVVLMTMGCKQWGVGARSSRGSWCA